MDRTTLPDTPPGPNWSIWKKNIVRGWGIQQPPGTPPEHSANSSILLISLFGNNFALNVSTKMIEIDTKILNFKHEICPGVGTFGKFSCPVVGTFRKKLCPTPGEFTSAQGGWLPERIEGSIIHTPEKGESPGVPSSTSSPHFIGLRPHIGVNYMLLIISLS